METASEGPVDADQPLGAIRQTARLLAELHPGLLGGDVRGGGAGHRLRLRLAGGEPALGTDVVEFPIEFVDRIDMEARSRRVVVLRSDQFSPILEVDINADPNSIRVQLAGEIAARLAREATPDAAASSPDGPPAADDAARKDWEAAMERLLTFRRTDHLSWVAWFAPAAWAQRLGRVAPPPKLPELPVFDDPPLSLNGLRRLAPALAMIPATYVSGTWAQRSEALIANSIANTVIQAIVQSGMDSLVDIIKRQPTAGDVLLAPTHRTPDSSFEVPPWRGQSLWTHVGKRVPANMLAAAVSWVLVSRMAGRFEYGGLSFALMFGSTLLGQTAIDAIEGRPADVARARHRHELAQTADFARNEFVRAAYYFMGELAARTGDPVRAEVAEVLLAARAALDGMRAAVDREVQVGLAETRGRRGFRFGYASSDPSFDLTRRGLPPGDGPSWQNALRMALRDGIGQLPSVALAVAMRSAMPLAFTNALATAASGAVYGFGERRAMHVAVADRGVAASWDTLHWIDQTIRWIDHLANPAVHRAPTGILDTSRFPISSDALFARATAAWQQYWRNRAAGRPSEMSGWNQTTYKHVPSLVTRMVVTAVVGPLLGLPGRLVGLLVVSAFVTGVLNTAENAVRQAPPVLTQLAADHAARRQVRTDPRTVSELAESVVTLAERAAAANNAILPHSTGPVPVTRNPVREAGAQTAAPRESPAPIARAAALLTSTRRTSPARRRHSPDRTAAPPAAGPTRTSQPSVHRGR